MKIVYSDDLIPEGVLILPVTRSRFKVIVGSIFLAGPTSRDAETPSWRPEALEILVNLGFTGTVFVPEQKTKNTDYDYNTQVEWEWEALHKSDVIVFWVPREIQKMPAFTTNVEFGFYLGKRESLILYGRPEWAQKKSYLDWLYKKVTFREPHTDLKELLIHAVGE